MALYNIDNIIRKFLNRKISKKEFEYLMAWINKSPDNKKYIQEFINIEHISNCTINYNDINSNEALKQVLSQIENRKKGGVSILKWWKNIAAILIIPLLGWFIYLYLPHGQKQYTNLMYQEIMSPYGMKSNITLPDSSKVWLNSGSELKFPLKFSSDKREVYLSGEGFFQVQSDKTHPFIVHTTHLDVKAVGTEFNVDAYKNDSTTTVSLKKGFVNILSGKQEVKNLAPNENFVFNNVNKKYKVSDKNVAYICAWKDGILAFRNEPLENVFKKISRNYNVEIEIKDNVIANQLYRATFENESLDEILKLLQISAPIRYHRIARESGPDNEYSKEKIEVYKK